MNIFMLILIFVWMFGMANIYSNYRSSFSRISLRGICE